MRPCRRATGSCARSASPASCPPARPRDPRSTVRGQFPHRDPVVPRAPPRSSMADRAPAPARHECAGAGPRRRAAARVPHRGNGAIRTWSPFCASVLPARKEELTAERAILRPPRRRGASRCRTKRLFVSKRRRSISYTRQSGLAARPASRSFSITSTGCGPLTGSAAAS